MAYLNWTSPHHQRRLFKHTTILLPRSPPPAIVQDVIPRSQCPGGPCARPRQDRPGPAGGPQGPPDEGASGPAAQDDRGQHARQRAPNARVDLDCFRAYLPAAAGIATRDLALFMWLEYQQQTVPTKRLAWKGATATAGYATDAMAKTVDAFFKDVFSEHEGFRYLTAYKDLRIGKANRGQALAVMRNFAKGARTLKH